MPPRTASQSETYSPYLTDPNGTDCAVGVKQNVADEPRPVKERNAARDRVIAKIHGRGLHLVFARELLAPNAGGRP